MSHPPPHPQVDLNAHPELRTWNTPEQVLKKKTCCVSLTAMVLKKKRGCDEL